MDATKRWEWIARRLLTLSDYGYAMEYFGKYIDEPDFLTDEWLAKWYGGQLEDYVLEDLHKVDILMAT